MILLISGTPGTGKTTVSKRLSERNSALLVEINQLIKDKHLYFGIEPNKKYLEVDMEALKEEQAKIVWEKGKNHSDIIFEGHLSHYYPGADLVIILRAHPSVLRKRLKNRGWNQSKIDENLQSEALDICTWEAYQNYGSKVQEVDTTNMAVDEVVDVIMRIIKGEEKHPVGNVNFLEDMEF